MMQENNQAQQSGTEIFIARLRDLSRKDTQIAGSKAAVLGELMSAGMPVPDGFVITTEAFDKYINSLQHDITPQTVIAGAVPPDIIDAVSSAAAEFSETDLAVRSSGIAEDLPDASFAGQYETVLGVSGPENLLTAVRRCWASAFNSRVDVYLREKSRTGHKSMAVLVQRMVSANVSGVAFTANPVTGDRTETVINAVQGLGERLVSGRATPDEWLVKDGQAICRSVPEGALSAGQAALVAELARKVEAYFGVPQDIEWAIVDDELFLLQARPITALPLK